MKFFLILLMVIVVGCSQGPQAGNSVESSSQEQLTQPEHPIPGLKSVFEFMSTDEISDVTTGTGRRDITASVQQGIDSIKGGGTLYFPAGTYKITNTLLLSDHRMNILGAGKQATRFVFEPSAAKSLFKFANASGVQVQSSIKSLSYSGQNNVKKIGIESIDVSEFTVEDVACYPWTGGGSECIQLRGREMNYFNRVELAGDLNLHILDNPNSTIDLDHSTFNQMYFLNTNQPYPLILVDRGTNLTNIAFTNNAWVGGLNGFYWDNATANQISRNISFQNVRQEGLQPGGFAFYIIHNVGIYNFAVDGFNTAGSNVYIHGFANATFRNLLIEGSGFGISLAGSGADLGSFYVVDSGVAVDLSGVTGLSGSLRQGNTYYNFTP